MAVTAADNLRERVSAYLRSHHTMTLATMGRLEDESAIESVIGGPATSAVGPATSAVGPAASAVGPAAEVPHAASVFYAVDDSLRLIFLSKPTSSHGRHIGQLGRVAVTVTEQYDDWEQIQGVQLWGTAKRLSGRAKAAAMVVYLRRFPFVRELLDQPRLVEAMRKVAVYRVEPERLAFTDNTTGVFGREVLYLKG